MASYSLLNDPQVVPLSKLPIGDALPEVGSLPEQEQPCVDSGETVLPVHSVAALDAYCELGILPARLPRARTGLLARLMDADELLPDGFGLIVLDGWRSLEDQRRLLDYYGASLSESGFVAPIKPGGARPPHTTGGAVDLTLSWQGLALGLGTDYDGFGEAARLGAFENGRDGPVRRLRRLLAGVMGAVDMVCYGPEWWHWSFGDDVWAAATGEVAIYDIWELQSNHIARARKGPSQWMYPISER